MRHAISIRWLLLGSLVAAGAAPPALAESYTVLYRFTGGADGQYPGPVVQDAEGNLYVQTGYGGAAPTGKVFGTVDKIDPAGNETTLVTFSGPNGKNPGGATGSLVLRNGKLYGVASAGGPVSGSTASKGLIFSVGTDGTGFVIHHHFPFRSADGYAPLHDLVAGPDHTIYGVAAEGGANGYGVLYALTGDDQYSVLYNFTSRPDSSLVVDRAGNIFGVVGVSSICGRRNTAGCGSVFEFTPSTGSFQIIDNFNPRQGRSPVLSVFGPEGTIYGAASYRGRSDGGTLFALTYDGAYKTRNLWAFNIGADGYQPLSGPLQTMAGNLVGTTSLGYGSEGTLYLFDGHSLTILHSFAGGADGQSPDAITVSASGAILGNTFYGGMQTPLCAANVTAGSCGTIYQYQP